MLSQQRLLIYTVKPTDKMSPAKLKNTRSQIQGGYFRLSQISHQIFDKFVIGFRERFISKWLRIDLCYTCKLF